MTFFKFKNWSTLVQTSDVIVSVNSQYTWCVNLVGVNEIIYIYMPQLFTFTH
jgi:hypothetical protein